MRIPPPRPDVRTASVPAFFLYGEPLRAPDERLVHVETLAARSRQHDWFIGAHRHRDLHQVLLVRRGRVEASLDGIVGDRRAPFAVIVPPGVVHAFRFQPDSAGLVVSFSTGLVRELHAMTPEIADFVDRPALYAPGTAAVDATDAWPLGQMLLREFGRAARGRHAALRGLLGALLANLWRLAGDTNALPAPARATRELIAEFRQAIEQRFRDHLPVAGYARLLGVSEARLRRSCTAFCGQSPSDLLHQRVRIEAERLLRYTSMPVTQVAYHLGFEDPAYFSRFFARQIGASPRAFRDRQGPTTGARAPVRARG